MQKECVSSTTEARCRQTAGRIAQSLDKLGEPFRQNTLRWLEGCVAKPIVDVNDDLSYFFSQLNPGMRETTMTSLEFVLEEAVRQFSRH